MAAANKDKEIITLLKNNAGFDDIAINTWFWIKKHESMLKEFYGMEHFPYEIYSFYMSRTTDKIEMDRIYEYIQNFSNLQSRQKFLQKYSEIKRFLQIIPFEIEQCLDYLRDYDIIEDPMYNYYKKKISDIVEPKNRNSSMKHNYDYMHKSTTLVALYKFWQSFPNKSEIIDGIRLFEENPENPMLKWAEFYKLIIKVNKIYSEEQRGSSSSTPSPINKIQISPEGKKAQPDYSRTGSGLAKALRQHEEKKKRKKKQQRAASIGTNNRLRDLRNAETMRLRQRQITDSSGLSEYGSDERDSPPFISDTAADATSVRRPSPVSSPLREASPPASDTCGPSGCMTGIMGGKRKNKTKKGGKRNYRKKRKTRKNKKYRKKTKRRRKNKRKKKTKKR